MPKETMKVWLEIATDILDRVFSALCHKKQIAEAEELQDIIRRLIVFSNRLRKKQPIVANDDRYKSMISPEALTAINAMGRKAHGEG